MLGNIYFYLLLLILLIVLIGITISNAIYFSDIYKNGSENLSSTQAQQLIILNLVVVISMIICGCFTIYMIGHISEMKIVGEDFKKEIEDETMKMDNKLKYIDYITVEKQRKEQTRIEMINLVKKVKMKSKVKSDKLKSEISKLQKHVDGLNSIKLDKETYVNSEDIVEKENNIDNEILEKEVIISKNDSTPLDSKVDEELSNNTLEKEVIPLDTEVITSKNESTPLDENITMNFIDELKSKTIDNDTPDNENNEEPSLDYGSLNSPSNDEEIKDNNISLKGYKQYLRANKNKTESSEDNEDSSKNTSKGYKPYINFFSKMNKNTKIFNE